MYVIARYLTDQDWIVGELLQPVGYLKVETFLGHTSPISSCKFSTSGDKIASASVDGTMLLELTKMLLRIGECIFLVDVLKCLRRQVQTRLRPFRCLSSMMCIVTRGQLEVCLMAVSEKVKHAPFTIELWFKESLIINPPYGKSNKASKPVYIEYFSSIILKNGETKLNGCRRQVQTPSRPFRCLSSMMCIVTRCQLEVCLMVVSEKVKHAPFTIELWFKESLIINPPCGKSNKASKPGFLMHEMTTGENDQNASTDVEELNQGLGNMSLKSGKNGWECLTEGWVTGDGSRHERTTWGGKKTGEQTDDVPEGDNEFNLYDAIDSDDEIVSDDNDSDDSQMSHDSRKKHPYFVELFDSLNEFTANQINEPIRQWHFPACRDGPVCHTEVLILSEKLHSVTSQFDQIRAAHFQEAINRAMPTRKPKRALEKTSTDISYSSNSRESRESTSSERPEIMVLLATSMLVEIKGSKERTEDAKDVGALREAKAKMEKHVEELNGD
ncbi:Zinc finger-XS domain-containing protein [Artemisia annua]|uniref:Zinc finger-XS domain-containing protein n=1 Tax=Artemisia annua TaxID=35608 RepID=A0A2U1KH29_ARTAN|nr:Zinc finger-XS domain-containing protein [Artemisia annua]